MQNSAIDELLQNLQGGPKPPSITPGGPPPGLLSLEGQSPSGPGPDMDPMVHASAVQGLLGYKPKEKSSMGHRILDWLSDRTVGQAPPGADKVFSQEDIEAAKPSIMQYLVGGGRDAWKENLIGPGGIQSMHALASGIEDQKRIHAFRQSLPNRFPPLAPDADLDTSRKRATDLFLSAAEAGDMEMAKAYESAAKEALKYEKAPAAGKNPLSRTNVKVEPGDLVGGMPSKHPVGTVVDRFLDPSDPTKILSESPAGAPPMSADMIAHNALTLAEQKMQHSIINGLAVSKEAESVGKTFMGRKDIASILPSNAAYRLAKDAFSQAATNPAALGPAFVAYAGVADPKAQLRQGIIEMVKKHIDASFKGTFEMALARLSKGVMPARVVSDMSRMIDQIQDSHRDMYETARKGEVRRNPFADRTIPNTDEVFKNPREYGNSGGTNNPLLR
jgi:hypothetical protein